MMREYKRYDEYKDSNIEWIGEIPKSWSQSKYKYYFYSSMGNTILKEDLIVDGSIPIYSATESDDIFGYINNANVLLNKNDFVIPARGNSIGNVTLVTDDKATCTQTTIYSKKVNKINSKYIYYYLDGLKDYLFNFTRTAIPQITVKQVSNNDILVPSRQEQQKIASFLDKKTAEIDEIINKKESLIDHLEKYKKSVITEAVTKSKVGNKYINEDGELVNEIEMKDSGVEWIGEIPEYWDIKKVKHSFQVINGSTPKTSNESYWDGNIVWITPADLDDNKKYISNSSRKITFEGLNSCSTNLIPKNNLIISSRAPIGYISINKVEVSTNQGCKSLVKISDENTEFYYYYFLSIRKVLNYYGNGTTFTELSAADLSQVDIISLNKNIQNIIINYLSEKTEEIDDFINKTKKSIDKYKEYKKSLIFEAVTGKIDLRDYELEGGEEIAEHNNSR